nr:hypothetical protein [Tanacetum cinerariifolium]
MSFSKRPGRNTPQCYTKPLDSLKNWNNRFFWVDERVFPTVVDWRTNAPKDGIPAAGTYSLEAVRVLDTHRTPIQKQPEMLLCLVGISRRYFLGDKVYGLVQFDTCPKSHKGEGWKSSGVPSTIERSPLDFAHEAGASDQGATTLEIPSSEDVPATVASGVGQAEETATMDPPTAPESRKRGHDGTDVNAPQSHCRGIMLTHNPQGAPVGGKVLLPYN